MPRNAARDAHRWELGWEPGGNESRPRVASCGRSCHLEKCVCAGNSAWAQASRAGRVTAYGTEGQRFESSRARCRTPLGKGISGRRRTPRGGNTGGNRATLMVLPLQPTEVPGVYRRGLRFVVVYRAESRQRKQSADTLAEARAIKLKRDGEARAKRRGPTLHEFSLSWLNRYAGSARRASATDRARPWARVPEPPHHDARTRKLAQRVGDRSTGIGVPDLRRDRRGVIGTRTDPALRARARPPLMRIEVDDPALTGNGSAAATSSTFAPATASRIRRSSLGTLVGGLATDDDEHLSGGDERHHGLTLWEAPRSKARISTTPILGP
jgi:hypothetical protein